MRRVKILTITLAIILVTLIAFVGIYAQNQNRMEDIVKDYSLGRELSRERVIELKVKESDGTEEISQEEKEKNYETVKKTIEKRLNKLKADDYTISLNKENGTIRVELAENSNTDAYAYYLTLDEKIKIKEKDAETELLSDQMVKGAQYTYVANSENKYQVYLDIELTKEGQAKIEEISNNYAILKDDIDNLDSSNETENTENTEENQDKTETKKAAVLSIGGTDYNVVKIEKGKIRVAIGTETANSKTVNSNLQSAAEMASLIDAGRYPTEYEIENNRMTYSDITKEQITTFIIIVAIILLLILIGLCIRYKVAGILSSIAFIGFISTFTLLLRYTNVLISIEGIGAILIILIVNLIINKKILQKTEKINMINEAINSTYKEMFLKLIPLMIIALVFSIVGWANLSSFGMIMFWGLILTVVYNLIITKTLLKLKENK